MVTTVLIAEDEAITAKDLQNRLTKLGYFVPYVVASGEEAIVRAAEVLPDVVLMDIVLKGKVDGIQAAIEIQDNLNVSVVFLTAFADATTVQRAKLAKPLGYIVKPFKESELNAVIQLGLYRRQMQQKLEESEHALRESEERFRFVLENSLDAAYRRNLATDRYDYISPVFTKITGWSADEMNAMSTNDLYARVHPDDVVRVREIIEQVTTAYADAQPATATLEYRFRSKNDEYRWLSDHVTVLANEDSKPLYRLGVVHDITDRKIMEAQLRTQSKRDAALADISRTLVQAGLDLQTVLEKITRRIAETLGDACILNLLSDDKRWLLPMTFAHADPQITALLRDQLPLRPYPVENNLSASVAVAGTPIVLANVSMEKIHPIVKPELWNHLAHYDKVSLMVVPLRNDGTVLGTLATLHFDSAEPYTTDDQMLLQDVADRTALAMTNARLHEQLQAANRELENCVRERATALLHSEHNYRQLVESAQEGVWVIDAEAKTTLVNPRMAEILGYSAEDMLGRPMVDFVDSAHLESAYATIERRKRGVREQFDFEFVRKNGETVYVSVGATPLHDEAGNYAGTLAMVSDITGRRQAEEQAHVSAARAEVLAHTASRLNRELDLNAVLNMLCEETICALKVSAVCIFLVDDKTETLSIAALKGLPAKYRTDYIPTPLARYPEYVGETDVLVVPDVQAEDDSPNAALYAELNIRTVASVSLKRNEQVIGRLTALTFEQPRQFTNDELALFQGLGALGVQAIANARTFETTQRRTRQMQALHGIDMAIASTFDLNVTLRIFLEEAMNQLPVDAMAILLLRPYLQTLEYAAGRGFRTHGIEKCRVELGKGRVGKIASERQMMMISNLAQASDWSRKQLIQAEEFVAYIGVPLVIKGKTQGVLEIFQRSPLRLDDEHLQFIDTLAGQAAIAVDNATLFNHLTLSNNELTLAYDTTLEGWSRALDLRDKETEGHTQRVAAMTVALARGWGIPEKELVHIRRGALLHDIGKIAIPDYILHKPEPLTEAEWQIMRQHPKSAMNLLSSIAYLHPALDIPYGHHEKWDGTGYPLGLKGEQIPLAARLFSIVDVWDALRSDRPYRPAWLDDRVRRHLRELAGSHFDPQVVKIFFEMLGNTDSCLSPHLSPDYHSERSATKSKNYQEQREVSVEDG